PNCTINVHDVSLVDGGDSFATISFCVLKRILSHTPTGWLGNQFDTLNNTRRNLIAKGAKENNTINNPSMGSLVPYLMLNSRVLSLGVLSNGNNIHVLVQGFISFN